MEMSALLIDFLNYTEVFIFSFTLLFYAGLLYMNNRKRVKLINSIKPFFKPSTPQKTLVKLLNDFKFRQEQLKKELHKHLLMMYGAHLVLYFMFLYGYYRFGALILGFLMVGIAYVGANYLYSRKVQ